MTALTTRVAVIGAGLIGASAALALRRQGVPVALLDADAPGAKASGVNFGGVRRQGRPTEQLHLAMRAHEIWPRLAQLIGIDGEYVRSGHLKLARSLEDLASLDAYRARTAQFDLGLEIIEGAEFRRRFPQFGPGIVGGSLCPEDGQANPRLVAPAFAQAARRAGAHLLSPCRVLGLETQGERIVLECSGGQRVVADQVINAAGAWGAELAARLGDTVPLRIKYPTMAVTEPLPPLVGVSIGVEGGGFYARQVQRGNVVMGGGFGTAMPGGGCRPGREAISLLGRNAPAVLPALKRAAIIRFWSGVEGYFDDKNPLIDFSAHAPAVLHAFGFSGAGFQISVAVGEVLADLLQGRPALRMAEGKFSLARFGVPAHATATKEAIAS